MSPRRSMTAHIEERPYAPVLAAHRHQRLAHEVQGVVIAGIGNIVKMAYDLPGSGENAFLLGFQEIRIPVDPARQAESFRIDRLQSGKVVIHRALCFHDPRALSNLVER